MPFWDWDDDDDDGDEDLHSEFLFSHQDEEDSEEERQAKRFCKEDDRLGDRKEIVDVTRIASSSKVVEDCSNRNASTMEVKRIECGILSKIPPELFNYILKFLSSEDLVSCSQVCKFMNDVASDGSLWKRLYHLRWGPLPSSAELCEYDWKILYIQQDESDLIATTTDCLPEFKEYYIQMHSAMRSESPLPSQVNDDPVADQFDICKSSKESNGKVAVDHACCAILCSYHKTGNTFVCKTTGNVHVCDERCEEADWDPITGFSVCRVSGRCFDPLSRSPSLIFRPLPALSFTKEELKAALRFP